MNTEISKYDFNSATEYHYNKFPPKKLDYENLVFLIGDASAALGRYDAKLQSLTNSDMLMAPMQHTEAIISSRIEGTVATLDEVLKVRAEEDDEQGEPKSQSGHRSEAREVYSYSIAMDHAHHLINEGLPICSRLVRSMHERLVFSNPATDATPGLFKTEPNYVADRSRLEILFKPIEPSKLSEGIKVWEEYMNRDDINPLIQTAIGHLEFEALHPFGDGNGRVGRMLIPLNLWDKKLITRPHFYVSKYLEKNRDEYLHRLRAVSAKGQWTEWVQFFLTAIIEQSTENIRITDAVQSHYEAMKDTFLEVTSSQYSTRALDYIFGTVIFRGNVFAKHSGIPLQTGYRILKQLERAELIFRIRKAAGRRPALFMFHSLIDIFNS